MYFKTAEKDCGWGAHRFRYSTNTKIISTRFFTQKNENFFKTIFFSTCTLRFKPVNRRDFTAVHGARNAGNGYYSPDFATGSRTKNKIFEISHNAIW